MRKSACVAIRRRLCVQPEQPNTNTDENEEVPTVAPVRPARKPARMTRAVRAALLAVAVALTVIFVAARYINPYEADGTPRTSATHTQLGMPPCNFKVLTDKGCPSCGMTTSFALLLRGDVMSSLRANWVLAKAGASAMGKRIRE